MTDRDDGPASPAGSGETRLDPRTIAIRDLNDQFRRTLQGGLAVMTSGVEDLDIATIRRAFVRVKNFETFTDTNDPYGEHDFGAFELDGARFFWKIDYYDPTMSMGSTDPTDPNLTRRVLTLMLSDEY